MLTDYKCPGCGRGATITSQGDLPLAIVDNGVTEIEIGGVKYPLKNDRGETLKNVLNGKAEYWTPPPIPAPPKIAE
ncbi:MAG TPA: hypothetical protein VHC44_11495, partial [Verrucomicrobiae bacterium]|nr:hypothetical protein [Verrucomicrobiae bacterium]